VPARVFAVVLTWNSGEDVLECLQHLAASDYPALEIVVVDNGSTDGTPANIAREFPNAKILQNQMNIGFAEGNNVGLRYALEGGADFTFLVNDDAFVEPEAVRLLVETAESDPHIGFTGPALVSYHNPEKVYYGARLDMRRVFPQEQLLATPPPDVFDSPYIAGCALLAKAKVAQAIGLLDPAYFAYWEDTDWCTRARRAGFRVVVQPNARVTHRGTLDQTPQKAAFASYLYRRNQFRFARKFKSLPGWLGFTRRYAYDALSEIQSAIKHSQPRAKTDAITDGWWAGITGHSGDDFARAPAWFHSLVYRHHESIRNLLYPIESLRARFPVRTTLRRWLRRTDAAKP
jgi:GT2 family glycosyltransferase